MTASASSSSNTLSNIQAWSNNQVVFHEFCQCIVKKTGRICNRIARYDHSSPDANDVRTLSKMCGYHTGNNQKNISSSNVNSNDSITSSLSNSDSVVQCSICLCDIDNRRKKYVTKCGHTFHVRCMKRWISNKQSPSCPNCREPINNKNNNSQNETSRSPPPPPPPPTPPRNELIDPRPEELPSTLESGLSETLNDDDLWMDVAIQLVLMDSFQNRNEPVPMLID